MLDRSQRVRIPASSPRPLFVIPQSVWLTRRQRRPVVGTGSKTSAAMWARASSKKYFAVLVIAPAAVSSKVKAEVEHFREHILMDEFHDRIVFTAYETYIGILNAFGTSDASELAAFLSGRIAAHT